MRHLDITENGLVALRDKILKVLTQKLCRYINKAHGCSFATIHTDLHHCAGSSQVILRPSKAEAWDRSSRLPNIVFASTCVLPYVDSKMPRFAYIQCDKAVQARNMKCLFVYVSSKQWDQKLEWRVPYCYQEMCKLFPEAQLLIRIVII